MLFPYLVPVCFWRTLTVTLAMCVGFSLAMACCTKKRKKPQTPNSINVVQESNEDTTHRHEIYDNSASTSIKKMKNERKGKKKDKGGKRKYKDTNDKQQDMIDIKKNRKGFENKKKPVTKPEKHIKYRDPKDVEYMTLAEIHDQIFDEPKAPPEQSKPKYKDPQDREYMTLIGLDNEVFDQKPAEVQPKPAKNEPDKKKLAVAEKDDQMIDRQEPDHLVMPAYPVEPMGARAAAPVPPRRPLPSRPPPQQVKGYKDPHDQRYQTLAGLDNQIFDQETDHPAAPAYPSRPTGNRPAEPVPPRRPLPSRPPPQQVKGYKDPYDQRYQTLAGLDNQIFDQEPDHPAAPAYPSRPTGNRPAEPVPPRRPLPSRPPHQQVKGYKDDPYKIVALDNQIFDQELDRPVAPAYPTRPTDNRPAEPVPPRRLLPSRPPPQQTKGYKDPYDQRYQTLAGLDNQIFDQEPDRPPDQAYPTRPTGNRPAAPVSPRRQFPRRPPHQQGKKYKDPKALDM